MRALQLFAANELGVFRDICRWSEFCSGTLSDQRTHSVLEEKGYTKYFDNLFKSMSPTPTVPLRVHKPQQQSGETSASTGLIGTGIVSLETVPVPIIPVSSDPVVVCNDVRPTHKKRKPNRHRQGYQRMYKKIKRLMGAVQNLNKDVARQLTTQYPNWSDRLEAAKLTVIQPQIPPLEILCSTTPNTLSQYPEFRAHVDRAIMLEESHQLE